jgi:hypothetical protein
MSCIATSFFILIRLIIWLQDTFTLIIIWLIVEQQKGGVLSKILVSTIFIFSVYARINILYQPNSFDILAWTCVFYFLIRYINEDRSVWLFFMMISFVLGLYNKYNIIFLFAGIVITKVAVVENQDARERGTSIFLLKGAKEEFSELFKAQIKRRRVEMDCF